MRGEFVVKVPLRVGAFAAPKSHFPINSGRPKTGKARRVASFSAAAAMVVCVGAASAVFVDYLADRARAADGPVTVRPMVAKAVETAADAKIALAAAAPGPEAAAPPAQAPIEAPLPDPAAMAKVAAAVGPEHAVELPTDDPTANPIVKLDAVADEAPVELAALSMDEADASDETLTAAIPAEEAEPEIVPKPRKPKAAKAKPAENRAAPKETEVASLPGVDVGGLAGRPTDDGDNAGSTVRTVTKPAKPAARNLGGAPAGAARVTAAVNMRSGPRKGAGVLTVVPAGSPVQVLSCNGWCQIAYNGRKGFIYKSYLAASNAKPQKQSAETADAAAPARGVQSPRLN